MKRILIAAIAALSFTVSAADVTTTNTHTTGNQIGTYHNSTQSAIKGITYKMGVVSKGSSESKDGLVVTASKEYINKDLRNTAIENGKYTNTQNMNIVSVATDNLELRKGSFKNTAKTNIVYGSNKLEGSVNSQKVTVSVGGQKPGGISKQEWDQAIGSTPVDMVNSVDVDYDFGSIVGKVRGFGKIKSIAGMKDVKVSVAASADQTSTNISQKQDITSGWTSTVESGTINSAN